MRGRGEGSLGSAFAKAIRTDGTLPEGQSIEVLGDSAYATGDMLHTLAGKKWVPLLKPWPIKPAVEGGFTTLVYEPYFNQGVAQNDVWQTWDAYNGGDARWWSSTSRVSCCSWRAITSSGRPACSSAPLRRSSSMEFTSGASVCTQQPVPAMIAGSPATACSACTADDARRAGNGCRARAGGCRPGGGRRQCGSVRS